MITHFNIKKENAYITISMCIREREREREREKIGDKVKT